MTAQTTVACLFINLMVALVLQGCGSGGSSSGGGNQVSSCGTKGAGSQYAVNDFHHKCTNCGDQPCYSGGVCYSCHGVDNRCYKYNCGSKCSNSPCSSPPRPKPSPVAPTSATCGTTGGGTTVSVNNPQYTCTNCGHRPCVSGDAKCYSCFGIDNKCYKYDCGTHCSATPCQGPPATTCGSTGYGDQRCVNNFNYQCYNCGPAPCVDAKGTCYSCYSPQTHQCFAYHCGYTCSTKPCGTVGAVTALAGEFEVNGMVPKMIPGANVTNFSFAVDPVPAASPADVKSTSQNTSRLSENELVV
eukprot:gnl/MRDRNA2_/MRDRNA2_30989_c0_seq1.p1 gnl/MRDRNA2_/MRDRNA2_30989_c0~~gnl/MRDRNA2_/MRDRNA2_30989_c0_seq1.p1  ORF type:complete len:300 (+),score=33.08 gnl/MRDRNA2_/MRDRNA2_30989_c0_seq1:93-992(+)